MLIETMLEQLMIVYLIATLLWGLRATLGCTFPSSKHIALDDDSNVDESMHNNDIHIMVAKPSLLLTILVLRQVGCRCEMLPMSREGLGKLSMIPSHQWRLVSLKWLLQLEIA